MLPEVIRYNVLILPVVSGIAWRHVNQVNHAVWHVVGWVRAAGGQSCTDTGRAHHLGAAPGLEGVGERWGSRVAHGLPGTGVSSTRRAPTASLQRQTTSWDQHRQQAAPHLSGQCAAAVSSPARSFSSFPIPSPPAPSLLLPSSLSYACLMVIQYFKHRSLHCHWSKLTRYRLFFIMVTQVWYLTTYVCLES